MAKWSVSQANGFSQFIFLFGWGRAATQPKFFPNPTATDQSDRSKRCLTTEVFRCQAVVQGVVRERFDFAFSCAFFV